MKTLKSKIKQTITSVLLAGLIALVPFYFETKAMTEDNRKLNVQLNEEVNMLKDEAERIKLDQALGQSEIRHNKEILLRIEKKVDELRAEVKEMD